jgi:hypothetical protein
LYESRWSALEFLFEAARKLPWAEMNALGHASTDTQPERKQPASAQAGEMKEEETVSPSTA